MLLGFLPQNVRRICFLSKSRYSTDDRISMELQDTLCHLRMNGSVTAEEMEGEEATKLLAN